MCLSTHPHARRRFYRRRLHWTGTSRDETPGSTYQWVLIQYPGVHNGTLVLTLHSGYLAPYVTNFTLVHIIRYLDNWVQAILVFFHLVIKT